MDFVERYRTGEHQQVWNDLQALGPAVRREPNYAQAREVAAETMRRVRRNCERLVSRLGKLGYVFGTFPDGPGAPSKQNRSPLRPTGYAPIPPNWRLRPACSLSRSWPSGRRSVRSISSACTAGGRMGSTRSSSTRRKEPFPSSLIWKMTREKPKALVVCRPGARRPA